MKNDPAFPIDAFGLQPALNDGPDLIYCPALDIPVHHPDAGSTEDAYVYH